MAIKERGLKFKYFPLKILPTADAFTTVRQAGMSGLGIRMNG